MMASKARLFGDVSIAEQVLDASGPKEAKALGRKVSGFNNSIWEENRSQIVVKGNYHKFMSNQELADFLLATSGKVLVEASPVDRVWGIGLPAHDSNASNPLRWRGDNLLGFALMEVRDLLTAGQKRT